MEGPVAALTDPAPHLTASTTNGAPRRREESDEILQHDAIVPVDR
jgi:hypothetical protein